MMTRVMEKTKTSLFGLTVLLCLLLVGQSLVAESRGKVLMILRFGDQETADYMLIKEFGVMKTTLEDAGFTVVVATVTGLPVQGRTVSVKPDLKLSEVQAADYQGFILPCMISFEIPPQSIEIVKEALAQGKPIAAQNMAVVILGKAGALKGKHFAIGTGFVPYVKDGTYDGIGVVQDGNIVTSGTCPEEALQLRKPDGTLELTKEFIALMQ
jgi:putative intracellular protease/amidase